MMNTYIVFGFLVLFEFWSEVSANYIQRIFANRGSTVILPCRFHLFYSDKYQVTWFRDGGANTITNDEQTPGSPFSVTDNWGLKISNLQPNNGGEYSCHLNTTPPLIQITKLQVQETTLDDTKRVLEVKERDDVQIECPVSLTHNEHTRIMWYKGGKPVRFYHIGENDNLVLFNVSKNDTGDYRCDVTSTHYTYNRQFTLHVKATPPTNIIAIQGSTVILPCKFTGVDLKIVKVYWYYGKGDNRHALSSGYTMYTPSRRYSIMEDGDHTWNLLIDDLQSYDGGEYTCQVNTGPPLRNVVNLQVQELKNRVKIKSATEGSTIVLPCSYDVNVDSPDIMVSWFDKNSIPVSSDLTTFGPRYGIFRPTFNQWDLKLFDVQSSDAGNFSCRLVTKHGTWNNTVVLVVGDPPNFDNMISEETMVMEGESLNLTCNSSGSPQPSVTWYKYSDQFEKHVVSQGQRLTLPHVTRYDAGKFECIAENGVAPTVSMKTDIKVEFAPEIDFPEGRLEVERGSETTILKCDVTSYPQSAVMWIRDGKKLFNSWKYRVEVTDETEYKKHVTLTINTIEDGDFGSYVCEARNKVDKTQKTLEIFGKVL